ncbi:MAG: hypothetical protein ACRC2U_19515 [Aeromonas sp.]
MNTELFVPVSRAKALAYGRDLPLRLAEIIETKGSLRTRQAAAPSEQARLSLGWRQLFCQLDRRVKP